MACSCSNSCASCTRHETVVPPDLLPLLLSFKDAEIRRRLVAVLGERGAWLCRQNPDYAWALTATAEQTTCDALELKLRFDEGTIEERCQALEAMPTMDPDGGRDWVEAVLPREKHGNRVKLLKSLRTGLSDRDEPFLEPPVWTIEVPPSARPRPVCCASCRARRRRAGCSPGPARCSPSRKKGSSSKR